jgi:hypothetical protein
MDSVKLTLEVPITVYFDFQPREPAFLLRQVRSLTEKWLFNFIKFGRYHNFQYCLSGSIYIAEICNQG